MLNAIARICKQPKCPVTDEKECVPYIQKGILCNHKKEKIAF